MRKYGKWVLSLSLLAASPGLTFAADANPATGSKSSRVDNQRVAEDIAMLKSEPKKVRGQHYDVVVNGVELGGGSIRIHQPDVQKTVFEEVLQIPPEETRNHPDDAHGGNQYVRARKGMPEVVAWAYDRPDGGRGFGFPLFGAHETERHHLVGEQLPRPPTSPSDRVLLQRFGW